jgi:predicted RNase H-like HicB family nuclease
MIGKPGSTFPCLGKGSVVIKYMKRKETVTTINAQYACTFRPEPGGGYTVRCAAFPELITNGGSLEEARAMAREALELCLEVYRDEGRPIPPADADPDRTVREVVPVKLARA